jgi:hypothetical protein
MSGQLWGHSRLNSLRSWTLKRRWWWNHWKIKENISLWQPSTEFLLCLLIYCLKADFQSSHEAPRSSLRVHAWALSSNHNAKQFILIRCKHSQRAARSFVRGLEIRLKYSRRLSHLLKMRVRNKEILHANYHVWIIDPMQQCRQQRCHSE